MDVDVLNPVRQLKVAGLTLDVRELSWPDALEFFKRLGSSMGQFVNERGEVAINAEKISSLVQGNADLVEFLITRSTSQQSDWLAQRSVGEVIDLLDAALSVNLSEELIQRGKRLAERVKGAFGLKTSAKSSIGS